MCVHMYVWRRGRGKEINKGRKRKKNSNNRETYEILKIPIDVDAKIRKFRAYGGGGKEENRENNDGRCS